MSKIKNKVGMKFGKLTVLSFKERKSGRTYWNCKCECGEKTIARGDKLTSGAKVSCGCVLKQNKMNIRLYGRRDGGKITHNMSNTRFYDIWKGMKQRCLNVNNKDYSNYGARGITICEKWMTFENFKNDMLENYYKHADQYGEKDTTIDRIDVDGNYEPDNCRWSTQKVQHHNKTNNKIIKFKGKEYIASDLAREYSLKPVTLFNRLNLGWDIEKALHTPIRIAK